MFQALYARYVVASGLSLVVDFGLFIAALAIGVPSAAAASVGYAAGILCHWLVSSRAVFADRLAERGAARQRQQALFIVSALIGLAITAAIVGVGTAYGLDPRLAKLVAIVVSFQATYIVRQKVVFA